MSNENSSIRTIPEAVHTQLFQALKNLQLEHLTESLFIYLELLHKWNQAYNLTAIRDPSEMIGKHFMDSLVIEKWIQGNRIIDVGTGPGFPGIPLALAKPECTFVLLDSNGKKTRFLREVKRTLSLDNVTIVESRAETYHPSQGFDTVTSRAFSSLSQMITWTRHLIAPHGLWLAMKGLHPQDELETLSFPWRAEHYQVSEFEGERCCILIENTQ